MSISDRSNSTAEQNSLFQQIKRLFTPGRLLAGFVFFSVFSIFFALLLLFVWLQVNLSWRTGELEHRLTSMPLVSGGSLEVSHPAVVLADQEFVTVTAALSTFVPLTETLILTLTAPNSLKLVVRPPSEAMTNTVTITTVHLNNEQTALGDSVVTITTTVPVSEQSETAEILLSSVILEFRPDTLPVQTFNLINAQTAHSRWWIFDARPQQCLNLISPYLQKGKDEWCLNVESVEGYSWRTFVNSTVDERNPLILLLAGLISAAGASLMYVFKKSQEDQHQREEREASLLQQEQERALAQEHTTKAKQLKATFQNCIKAKDVDGAQSALRELKNDSDLCKLSGEDLVLMEKLVALAIASAEDDIREMVGATTEWPEECAHAYLMCRRQLYSVVPDKLREAQRLITIERIRDDELLAELAKVAKELYSRQSAEWRSLKETPPSPTLDSRPVFLAQTLEGHDPFIYERAEDDQEILFGALFKKEEKRGFWNHHPVFRALKIQSRPQLVFGNSGSGKTAMALAFGLYKLDLPARLALYLPGQPETPEIVAGFAQQLLAFVKRTPTLLGDLSTDERMLLANLLVGSLGRAFVLADLTETQNSGEWWKEVSKKEDSKDEKRDWERLGNAQFNLLKQAVRAAPASIPHESYWPREVVRCAASLTYKQDQVLLVIDGNGATPEWVNQMIALRIRQWWLSGVVTFMFLHESMADQINIDNGVMGRLFLNWDASQVNEMIRLRFERVKMLDQIDKLFEDGLLQEMVAVSKNNPQRFIQLWHACVQFPKTGDKQLTHAHLQMALQR
jgi:hypothetical protein